MVSEDLIVWNEVMNDGCSAHLYFSEMYDEYVAYGNSSYIICKAVSSLGSKTHLSYSDHFQMPMVRVDDTNLQNIRQKMTQLEADTEHIFFCTTECLDENEYVSWASVVRG